MAKEFTITVDYDGTTTIDLKGYELESKQIAQDFEEVLGGNPQSVQWSPKQHLKSTVKAGH